MKARLIKSSEVIQLPLHTGKIYTLSKEEAREFLLNFKNPKYYSFKGVWDYELSISEYSGTTIAFVDDNDLLCIENEEIFRDLFTDSEIKLLTVPEYAALHGRKPAIVRRMCGENRIAGVILKVNTWLIPENSPYPDDERKKQ